jgi:GMP synthase (glutamine-hydrolysing)
MTMREIPAAKLDAERFIEEQARMVSETVGASSAINALSGGVDSSTVTRIGHKALGSRLRTYFIDNGLMREGEPEQVVKLFQSLGVPVQRVDAREEFLNALKGIRDPEEKRKAVSQTFYKKVFGRLIRETGAEHLLRGTILTDTDSTAAGMKRQHAIVEKLGINSEDAISYQIVEPLAQLRKDGVRKVAEALGLPASVYNRMPFPSPALAVRVIGEATAERLVLVRKATAITEECLIPAGVFQCMAILHEDRVIGMREGKRDHGLQIEIRCWDRHDARRAFPTRLDWETLENLSLRILDEVPGVVSVTYNIAPKPPSTLEAV